MTLTRQLHGERLFLAVTVLRIILIRPWDGAIRIGGHRL